MAILEIKNLSFSYPESDTQALKNINLTIDKGEFAVICGASGSGKSTLLSLLKKSAEPFGKKTGEINLNNSKGDEAIAFVSQNPFSGTVTDKVWHELAFSMECKNISRDIMKMRVAETVEYFGLQSIINNDIASLSGGQLQKVKLAAAVENSPEILILDEPTAQLDPICADEFIMLLKKLNDDFGITVIVCEHNPEEIFEICDTVILMDDGKILKSGRRDDTVRFMNDNGFFGFLPAAAQANFLINKSDLIPFSCRDGKKLLETVNLSSNETTDDGISAETKNILSINNVFFRYSKGGNDVLNGINLKVNSGEIFCLFGANGSGKTTLISLICGFKKPYSGKISAFGKKSTSDGYLSKIGYLPQKAVDVFSDDTVYDDYYNYLKALGYNVTDIEKIIVECAKNFGIDNILHRNPANISGGELQRAALCKVLFKKPELLVLDEPTKGVDRIEIENIAEILNNLKKQGTTVLIVTHDMEFAAACGTKAGIIFNGELVYNGTVRCLCNNSTVYTTGFSGITKEKAKSIITLNDFKKAIGEKQ